MVVEETVSAIDIGQMASKAKRRSASTSMTTLRCVALHPVGVCLKRCKLFVEKLSECQPTIDYFGCNSGLTALLSYRLILSAENNLYASNLF
jgi:hypothetical protein